MCVMLWPSTLWLYCGCQAPWAILILLKVKFTSLQVLFDTTHLFELFISLYTVYWFIYCAFFISSSFFSFDPGSFRNYVCGTHCPDHMEALQMAALQWQWTLYVTSRNSLDTKETLSIECYSLFVCLFWVFSFSSIFLDGNLRQLIWNWLWM